MAARALLYINPRSRFGHDDKAAAIAQLARADVDVIDVSTTQPRALVQAAKRHKARVDRIVVGGGDGTLNGLLEPLVKIGLPIGLLPLGTANDLAATLGIPSGLARACALIGAGDARSIDLGWVNGKHYASDASLGLSSRVIRDIDPDAKKRWGVFAIAARAAEILSKPRAFHARIQCGGQRFQVRTYQITIGNGERFGGIFKSPDADIADHMLDLYSVEVRKLSDVLGLLPALAAGRSIDGPAIRFQRAREFRVTTQTPRHIYTDGERVTQTPAHFKVVPSALTVFAPTRGARA